MPGSPGGYIGPSPVTRGINRSPVKRVQVGSRDTAFTETWTGANGAAWPAPWVTGTNGTGGVNDIQSNTGRQVTPNAAGVYEAPWAILPFVVTDFDITVKVQFAQAGSLQEQYLQIGFHMDQWLPVADPTYGGGEPTNGYVLLVEPLYGLEIARWDAGTLNAFLQSQPVTFTADQTVWVRVQMRGSTIRATCWNDGESQPTTGGPNSDGWLINVADAAYASGKVGLAHQSASANLECRWDDFSLTAAVGANGTADGTFAFTAPATGTPEVTGTATTALAFSGPVTGTPEVTGSSTTAFAFGGPAIGTREVTGSLPTALVFAAPATGTRETFASAATALVFSGPATGTEEVTGTAATALTFAGPATGTPEVTGTIITAFAFAVPATGTVEVTGAVATVLTFSGAATGTRDVFGTAATALVFSGDAAGTVYPDISGTATGAFVFSGPATGTVDHFGTIATALAFAGPATGTPEVTGTAATALVFSGPATGTVTTPGVGTATGNFTFAGPATGTVEVTGTGAASLSFAGPATGTVDRFGTAATTLVFGGPATGTPEVTGQASTALTFSAPAAGTPEVTGTATAALAFSGAATGTREVTGGASAPLTFTGSAVGSVIVSGVAVASFVFAGPATGLRETFGSATTALVFAAPATGSGRSAFAFDYGHFLEYVRASLATATGRDVFLTAVDEGVVPSEPFAVVHAFGPSGALERAFDGQAVALSFYLQIDGVGRGYRDAMWMLDRCTGALRDMEPPSYVADLLVGARSSSFEISSEDLRAVGQRMSVRLTRVGA